MATYDLILDKRCKDLINKNNLFARVNTRSQFFAIEACLCVW